MKRMVGSLEGILVSFSVVLLVGYHGYLWYCFKKKPFSTTIGNDVHNRRIWFLNIMKDVEKNGTLGVQTLRNIQMVTILNASFAIILNTALAALTNNSYKASDLFKPTIILGSKSAEIFTLKYGLVSFTLLLSFFCSSVALAFFMDANVLINVLAEEFSSFDHTKTTLGRGSLFALVGNRLLLIAFPLVLWAFGPFSVVLSSLGLVWWLHQLDFVGKLGKRP